MIWKMTQIGLNPKPFNFLVKLQKTIWKMTQIGLNPKPLNFFIVKFQRMTIWRIDTNWEKIN